MKPARLEIPPHEAFLEPAVAFILAFADRFEIGAERRERFRKAAAASIFMVIDRNGGGKSDENVVIELEEASGKLQVRILNRGVPIMLGAAASCAALFNEASQHAESISIRNEGRAGQTVSLELSLGAATSSLHLEQVASVVIPGTEAIDIRPLRPGEEEALSRLFYLVYGYNYINEDVYYPQKLKAMLADGKLLSIVAARPNGRLIGHVGLVRRSSSPPVYEAAMGAVDPAAKSRGVFGRLFHATIELAQRTPMQYCFFDFVTNHDLSQKHIARYDPCELAILVGCQSRETQARLERIGIGHDPEGMDRYSLLTSIIPRVPRPFGAEVAVPDRIGGPFGFLLEPLGMRWSPSPRFETLPSGGRCATTHQSAQSAVLFDLSEPGREAVDQIIDEWGRLLREGCQYAAVEAPLDRPGLGNLYELLSSSGFFAAGFVPYRWSNRLAFRFQAIGPTKVAFDKIKVHTDNAKRLLKLIEEDHAQSCLI